MDNSAVIAYTDRVAVRACHIDAAHPDDVRDRVLGEMSGGCNAKALVDIGDRHLLDDENSYEGHGGPVGIPYVADRAALIGEVEDVFAHPRWMYLFDMTDEIWLFFDVRDRSGMPLDSGLDGAPAHEHELLSDDAVRKIGDLEDPEIRRYMAYRRFRERYPETMERPLSDYMRELFRLLLSEHGDGEAVAGRMIDRIRNDARQMERIARFMEPGRPDT